MLYRETHSISWANRLMECCISLNVHSMWSLLHFEHTLFSKGNENSRAIVQYRNKVYSFEHAIARIVVQLLLFGMKAHQGCIFWVNLDLCSKWESFQWHFLYFPFEEEKKLNIKVDNFISDYRKRLSFTENVEVLSFCTLYENSVNRIHLHTRGSLLLKIAFSPFHHMQSYALK